MSIATAKKALVEMKRLGLLDVVAEMMEKIPAFRNALLNWAGRQRVQLLFEALDLGLAVSQPLDFLAPAQQARLRELAFTLPDAQVERLVAALKQPGKAMDTSRLVTEFNLVGAQFKAVTLVARELLLDDPDLLQGGRLTDEVRLRLLRRTPAQRVAYRFMKRAGFFNVGDPVLYGKYKNKRGVIRSLTVDPKGNPLVEIEPVPKGRKQNKVLQLFRIWHDPPPALAQQQAPSMQVMAMTDGCHMNSGRGGGWVSPEGRFFQDFKGTHNEWAEEYLRKYGLEDRLKPGEFPSEALLRFGWVRHVSLLLYEAKMTPSREAYKTIAEHIQDCLFEMSPSERKRLSSRPLDVIFTPAGYKGLLGDFLTDNGAGLPPDMAGFFYPDLPRAASRTPPKPKEGK